ncbi:hypothetical protein ACFSHT_29510 [Paraburkholderia silviterrae]|uniref:hypothetical protein n=1 Tax=Paraburkholderia silviterrae TaxID=2528715 RepID=UPI0014046187|nr:hypothetical protein [Paraburkholderia silviterrae]
MNDAALRWAASVCGAVVREGGATASVIEGGALAVSGGGMGTATGVGMGPGGAES